MPTILSIAAASAAVGGAVLALAPPARSMPYADLRLEADRGVETDWRGVRGDVGVAAPSGGGVSAGTRAGESGDEGLASESRLALSFSRTYGLVWCGVVRYGMVWYGMARHGMVWYGMVCYSFSRTVSRSWPSPSEMV